MTLTPEQFKKIALKSDILDFKAEVLNLSKNQAEMVSTIDWIAKMIKDNLDERSSNIAAHDRIQTDVSEVRTHIGLKIKNPALGNV